MIKSNNLKNYVIAIAFIFGILITGLVTGVFQGSQSSLPWYAGSPSPYSWIVDTNSTHCFAYNGTTGYLSYTVANTSFVSVMNNLRASLTRGGTIEVRDGYYLINDDLILNRSGLVITGQRPFSRYGGTVFLMATGGGLSLAPDQDVTLNGQHWLSTLGIHNIYFVDYGYYLNPSSPTYQASHCIHSDNWDAPERMWQVRISDCRFQGFLKDLGGGVYPVTINLTNAENCEIHDNEFFDTRNAHVRAGMYGGYETGNNVFYRNHVQFNGLRLVNNRAYGLHVVNSGWLSKDNHCLQVSGYTYQAWLLCVEATAATSEAATIHSERERAESVGLLKAFAESGESVTGYCKDSQLLWTQSTLANFTSIYLGANTRRFLVMGNHWVYSDGFVGKFVVDTQTYESATTREGYRNVISDNIISTIPAGFTPLQFFNITYITEFRNNRCANPVGYVQNFRLTGTLSRITMMGTASTVSNNTQYRVCNTDIFLTVSGGSSVNVTILDFEGNKVATGISSCTAMFIPYLYHVYFVFASAPTVLVHFN